MNDKQVQKLYEAMLAEWNNLPSPIHEPKRFEFYVKMFKYCYNDKWNRIVFENF